MLTRIGTGDWSYPPGTGSSSKPTFGSLNRLWVIAADESIKRNPVDSQRLAGDPPARPIIVRQAHSTRIVKQAWHHGVLVAVDSMRACKRFSALRHLVSVMSNNERRWAGFRKHGHRQTKAYFFANTSEENHYDLLWLRSLDFVNLPRTGNPQWTRELHWPL
jgi:hypothetical protein